jgi:hypothetical protein
MAKSQADAVPLEIDALRRREGVEARANFRLLARALNGDCELTPDEWRKSRRALVALIRRRLAICL